jgi:hypothetical protein
MNHENEMTTTDADDDDDASLICPLRVFSQKIVYRVPSFLQKCVSLSPQIRLQISSNR